MIRWIALAVHVVLAAAMVWAARDIKQTWVRISLDDGGTS